MMLFFPGACTVRLEMPLDMQSALIFHYNLKFYNNDTDNYEGVSLKRFVMQVSFYLNQMQLRIINLHDISVGSRKHGCISRARSLLRLAPAGYIRQRRHTTRIPYRRAHEV